MCCFLISFQRYIYLLRIQSNRGKEKRRVSEERRRWGSMRDCNSENWARAKLGTLNFNHVSHMSDKGPSTWSAAVAFLGPLVGSWIRGRKAGVWTIRSLLIWNTGVTGGSLTYCITTLTPQNLLFQPNLLYSKMGFVLEAFCTRKILEILAFLMF